MEDTTGSGSPSSPSSPPPRHSRSQFQLSSSSSKRRRWSPQSPSPSGGRQSRSPSWSPPATVEEGAKTLYMFFWYPSSPIAYGLYAINVRDPVLPLPASQPCSQSSELNTAIYPILEFRQGDYPEIMCCVELESKLYFFGGRKRMKRVDWLSELSFPTNVYVLDTATLSAHTEASNQPSDWLSEGIAMTAGKMHPYGFVADKKIYAYGASRGDGELARFEVFDPVSNKWKTLSNPPVKVRLMGHAMVNRNIFIVTANGGLFSYNLDTHGWVDFSGYSVLSPPFLNRAKVIGDTLYGTYKETLVAYGPTSESILELQDEGLFERMAVLSPSSDVGEAVDKLRRPYKHASCLVHLSNRLFCYVVPVSRPDPENPRFTDCPDPENVDVSIITFEPLRETHTEPRDGERDKTFFRTKLLHDAQYVARSKCGAIVGTGLLLCCYSISTLGSF